MLKINFVCFISLVWIYTSIGHKEAGFYYACADKDPLPHAIFLNTMERRPLVASLETRADIFPITSEGSPDTRVIRIYFV